ncbi:MAG TPA: RidA family protein [Actinomycetota bacterium]|nr:RidA family protein [Actinomycetota bacterium]
MKTAISSSGAPAAIGPYSQAVRAGDYLFCSGQIPLDPETGELVGGGIAEQTTRVLENVRAVLASAGLEPADVVKTTVFLVSMADFPAMNEVYGRFFSDVPPARSTIGVAALPKGAAVEIEVVAQA